ncbi:hypothetical protein C8F01DRAFT_1131298 [Mycena amicta]|nr:hypothetical protein C8F01DRAFT_1131298 [Mycena amicta]
MLNEALPKTSATLTLRVIKSFVYRTERSLVLHNVDLETTTVAQLKDMARRAIATWKPFRDVSLDTLKLYTHAHGAKTTNLIINLDHDDWILKDDDKLLVDLRLRYTSSTFILSRSCSEENETEVSFFNHEMYTQFQANPQVSVYDCTTRETL